MNYIVVGCGRVGAELAYSLYLKGHKVSVIDHIAAAFNNLHPDFRGKLVEGEALNRDVLYRAGIETADGLVSVTNSDTLNAVVAHIARTAYNIRRTKLRSWMVKISRSVWISNSKFILMGSTENQGVAGTPRNA